jgi:hypothetical protein
VADKSLGQCSDCRKVRAIKARGLCSGCYARASREGRLAVKRQLEQAESVGALDTARKQLEDGLEQFVADYKLASKKAAQRGDHRPSRDMLRELPLENGRRVLEVAPASGQVQVPQNRIFIGLALGGSKEPAPGITVTDCRAQVISAPHGALTEAVDVIGQQPLSVVPVIEAQTGSEEQ